MDPKRVRALSPVVGSPVKSPNNRTRSTQKSTPKSRTKRPTGVFPRPSLRPQYEVISPSIRLRLIKGFS